MPNEFKVRNGIILANSLATSQVDQSQVLLDNTISTGNSQTITITRVPTGGLHSAGYRGLRIYASGITNTPTIRYTDINGTQNTSTYLVSGITKVGSTSTGSPYTSQTYVHNLLTLYYTPSLTFNYTVDIYLFRRWYSLTTGCQGYGMTSGNYIYAGNGSNFDGLFASYWISNASANQNFEGVYFTGNVAAGGFVKIYGVI